MSQAQGREEGSVVVLLVAVCVLVEEGGDVVDVPTLGHGHVWIVVPGRLAASPTESFVAK